ncbi:MAG TPA: sialate O-acetylesterase, partial [Armatimonadota bacterium]|nr:sialate O-acetylesterase [Armatimonadota bacterium]
CRPQTNAVFQRDENGVASVPISGNIDAADGALVRARVSGEWTEVATVQAGAFAGELPGLRTGGPHELEIAIGDQMASVGDLMVGDLFILAGQSNMDGCGKLVDCEEPHESVRCFYYDDRWAVAEDPLCWYNEAVDPVHWGEGVTEENRAEWIQFDRDFRVGGAGLGVRFGKEIHERIGVPVGLLACSHGGTSQEQWSPRHADLAGRSLYGSMLRRVEAVGGKVKACLWYQGESDANSETAPLFEKNMRALIEAIRADLSQPDLPFLQVQLGPFYNDEGFDAWNDVQLTQLALEDLIHGVATVAAIDLELSDAIHISTGSGIRLGERMAHVAQRFVYGDESKQFGPRLTDITVSADRRTIELRFTGVNGSLLPASGSPGFTIDAGGEQVAIPERAVRDASTVVLGLREPLPANATLWHGRGLNPAVGLRDEADLTVPVFARDLTESG